MIMRGKKYFSSILLLVLSICTLPVGGFAQANGTLKGTVTLETSGKPVHNVVVTIIQLKRAAETDDNGAYAFENVPAGTYDVVAHLDRVPDVVQKVQVTSGNPVTADFQIRLRVVGEQVTITGSESAGTEGRPYPARAVRGRSRSELARHAALRSVPAVR